MIDVVEDIKRTLLHEDVQVCSDGRPVWVGEWFQCQSGTCWSVQFRRVWQFSVLVVICSAPVILFSLGGLVYTTLKCHCQ